MRDLIKILMNDDFFGFSNFKTTKIEFPKEEDPNWSKSEETFENKTHFIRKEIWTSKDGFSKIERIVSDLKVQHDIEDLRKQLKSAVEKEDFEKAVELRDKIKELSK